MTGAVAEPQNVWQEGAGREGAQSGHPPSWGAASKASKGGVKGCEGAPHKSQDAGVLRVLPRTSANCLLIPESWMQVRNHQSGDQRRRRYAQGSQSGAGGVCSLQRALLTHGSGDTWCRLSEQLASVPGKQRDEPGFLEEKLKPSKVGHPQSNGGPSCC